LTLLSCFAAALALIFGLAPVASARTHRAPKPKRSVVISLAAPAPGDIAYADFKLGQNIETKGVHHIYVRQQKGHPVPASFAVNVAVARAAYTYNAYNGSRGASAITSGLPPSIGTKKEWFIQISIANPVDPRHLNVGPRPSRIRLEVVTFRKGASFAKLGKIREANNIVRTHAKLFPCYFPRSWANDRAAHVSTMQSWLRYSDHYLNFFTREELPNIACPGKTNYVDPWVREAVSGTHPDGTPATCLRQGGGTWFPDEWTYTVQCLTPITHIFARRAPGETTVSWPGHNATCSRTSEGANCDTAVPANTDAQLDGHGVTGSSDSLPSEIDVSMADGTHDHILNPFTPPSG
jgi:hypothetical protein